MVADIIELILADHQRIRRLQAGLRVAARLCGSEPSWVLPRAWDGLAVSIEAHITGEEEICWPAVSAACPPDPALLREVATGSQDIREAIADAAPRPAGSPGWWRSVNDALRACSLCLDREERGLSGLARHSGPELRDQLGRQWLAFLSDHGGGK